MARYTQTITLNKPDDFVQFMVNDYLQKYSFTPVNWKGEQVYRAGDALFQGYRYLKWSYVDGVFHLEAWFKGTFGGENDLTGIGGAAPKGIYKKSLLELIDLLQQNDPTQSVPESNATPMKTVDIPYYATLSLITGIISLIFVCCVPLLSIILGGIAIANAKNAAFTSKKKTAMAGKICGIIGVSLGTIVGILNILIVISDYMG